MSDYQPDLPARDVDRRLRGALAAMRRAERNAVLWFAEVLRRKLYRDLGYGSIQQYAELALGFGPAKTAQFIRLAGALEVLPRLRGALRRGELTWTQARTVAGVATPKTEGAWLEAARKSTSRGLEATVRTARVRARTARGSKGQERLGLEGSQTGRGRVELVSGKRLGEPASGKEFADPAPVPSVESLPLPRDIHFRFSPEQAARLEGLLEAVRKRGIRGDRAELLLAGLEALAAASNPEDQGSIRDSGNRTGREGQPENPKPAARTTGSPYQVLVRLCPSCAGGSVVAGRESRALHPRELRAILCDARIRRPGERNRAVIPPRVRRSVLERDGYRCRGAGCRSAQFLAVHHLVPRAAGGSNSPENLVTLCAACHRALHVVEATGPHAASIRKGIEREPRPSGPVGDRLSPAAAGWLPAAEA